MADFFKSLTSGFGTGLQISQAMRDREERDRLLQQRQELQAAYGLTPQEESREATLARAQAETQALAQQDAREFGLSPQDMQSYAPAAPVMPAGGQSIGVPTYTIGGQTFRRQPTEFDIDAARTRAAANVYGKFGDTARREELLTGLRREQRAMSAEERAAAAEGRAISAEGRATAEEARRARDFGLTIGERETEAARKKLLRENVERWNKTDFGNDAAKRNAALVSIYEAYDPVKGLELLRQQQSTETGAIQLADARRTQAKQTERDTGFATIAGTQYKTPEDKSNAILALIEKVDGPAEAAKLKATYTSQQINDITLQASRFDQQFTEAFRKGPDAVIAFVDELNPGFVLERDPKNPLKIIQIDENGKRSTFIEAKSNEDLMNQLQGRRSPSAFVALSKDQFDRKVAEDKLQLMRGELKMKGDYYKRLASEADAKTPEAKLAAIQKVIGRDLTEDEKLIAVGLQVKDKPEREGPTAKELDIASDMVGKPVLTSDGKQRLDKDGKPLKHDLRSALTEVLTTTRPDKAAGKSSSGLGSNPYTSTQTGTATAPAATTGLTTASARAPALTADNTKLLSAAGNTGYNVELPDGTTRVMSISQLEQMGYRFPSGTGLQRPWYADLLPGR